MSNPFFDWLDGLPLGLGLSLNDGTAKANFDYLAELVGGRRKALLVVDLLAHPRHGGGAPALSAGDLPGPPAGELTPERAAAVVREQLAGYPESVTRRRAT
jgi:hypothetical protein